MTMSKVLECVLGKRALGSMGGAEGKLKRAAALAAQHPRAAGFSYKYGTAGFREEASVLDSVCVRMGMLAWLRALQTGQAVGLMVTASHNPVADNGLKAVDPDGGMLAPAWEAVAVELMNAGESEVEAVLGKIVREMRIEAALGEAGAEAEAAPPAPGSVKVVVGRDTRPHSARLSALALAGVAALGGRSEDVGVVTTPQLHHCVRSSNLPEEHGLASVAGYYAKLSRAALEVIGDRRPQSGVIVDAAFGVGGPRVTELLRELNRDVVAVRAEVRNSPTGAPERAAEEAAKLNVGVGAEHVQKGLVLPERTLALPAERGARFASFDGDADRIVFFRATDKDTLNLFDGDKIACLLTMFIQKQLAASGLKAKLGCVQTAYANGASSRYIRDQLKVEAPLTKTGVKHLHHKALEYDIGVYFEANGHGTVLFSRALVDKVRAARKTETDPAKNKALRMLLALEQLINQATGDAMADLLAVEAVLCAENLSLDDWDAMYKDLPSRQLKCKVKDRAAIKTSEDETKVLQPVALQNAIDAAVKKYASGRAFARPSGTEDAVRVYAEAETPVMADKLALEVSQAIFDHAGGVGKRPA